MIIKTLLACMTFMFVVLLADACLRQMQQSFTHRHVNRTIEAVRHVHLATEGREPDNQLNGVDIVGDGDERGLLVLLRSSTESMSLQSETICSNLWESSLLTSAMQTAVAAFLLDHSPKRALPLTVVTRGRALQP
jgi:hypothetical protein